MFCPICRVEHREGFTRCLECNVDLVNELPPEPEPEYEHLVAVFEGGSASAAMALALVKSAGIESWTRDKEVHALFPSLGLSQVLVREEDEKPAAKILETPKHEGRHGCNLPSPGHFLTPSGADKNVVSGNQGKNSSMAKKKQYDSSAKSHQDKGSRRQGKRV